MSSFFSFKETSNTFIQDSNLESNFPKLSTRSLPFQKHAKTYNKEFGKVLSEGPYNKETKPDGVILLGVSENKLMDDYLNKELHEIFSSSNTIPTTIAHYTAPHGLLELRQTLSKFLSEKFLNWDGKTSCPIDPNHLVVSTGCVASLTLFSRLLFESNESILIPAPYYPAFDHDFGSYGSVKVIEVHPDPSTIINNNNNEDVNPNNWFESKKKPFGLITNKSLEDSYNKSIQNGHKPKAFLYTNPNNPTGQIYLYDEIIAILKFCSKYNLHFISDEVYGINRFGQSYPYISILNFLLPYLTSSSSSTPSSSDTSSSSPSELSDSSISSLEYLVDFPLPPIHFLWSISKDLSLSGFRVGITYSPPLSLYRKDLINYNERTDSLIYSLIPANDAFMVSNLTQYFLNELLNNKKIINNYFNDVIIRLKNNLNVILNNFYYFINNNNHINQLYKLDDIIIPSQGGLFVLINLSYWLKYFDNSIIEDDNNKNNIIIRSKEENFFYYLLKNGILLTPSEACNKTLEKTNYLGHFRCCYAYVNNETLSIGINRLINSLINLQDNYPIIEE